MARPSIRGVALVAGAALTVSTLALGCTADRDRGTPTPVQSPTSTAPARAAIPTSSATPGSRTASPSPSPRSTPELPHRVTFAAGATIDVANAVVFANLDTLEAEAWVIPGVGGEVVVSPAGSYVIYATTDGFRLLRTDTGTVRNLAIGESPAALGPGDTGFIARGRDRFVGSLFDGQGRSRRDLWLSDPDAPFVASWAPDGEAIAIAQIGGQLTTVAVTIWPELMGEQSVSFRRPAVDAEPPSLEWSPDSQRLAVVTADAVTMLDRDRSWLWTIEGEFSGNPRWSPEGRYLSVFAKPSVVARDGGEAGTVFATYVFTSDGDDVLRFPAGGACEGNPWFDATSFAAFSHRVYLDGRVTTYEGPSADRWERLEDLGFEVGPDVGYHWAHIAARDASHRLEDGRLVFTTVNAGHGGCGEGSPPTEWPAAEVDRPPYGPVRAAPADR
ncbi:MAG: hypothetical protein O3A10_00300 [Chloroflexi bacterium]|nr:hypothetical protein [Chloroflexota bacterium]MDA1145397.1 hypothetical protein [Chloroflexota bacterium]